MNLTAAQKKTVLAALPRLDARRLRFLPPDIPSQGHCEGVRRRGAARRLCVVPDAGDALRRRLHLRPDRRPMGPQAGADARHRLLFGDRRGGRLLAQPCGLPRAAHAVRRRHGRRMGVRLVAGDGIDPAAGARLRLRHSAERLSHRLPARGDRLRAALRTHVRRLHGRVARDVFAQRAAGPGGAVHPQPRAGIARLRRGAEDPASRPMGIAQSELAIGDLRRRADDVLQPVQPRHAGPLPDLPAKAASVSIPAL